MGPFEMQLRGFAQREGARADVAVREVVFEVGARLIVRSPVDTGRFRGNWFYSLDAPDRMIRGASPVEAAAIYQGAMDAAYPTIINALGKMPIEAGGRKHYLQNNLPYALPLERGHSKQAPQGMVDLTVREFAGIVDGAVSKAKALK